MEQTTHSTAGDHRAWWLVLLGLLIGQGWLTLSLFGVEQPWERLLDDQPIVSGRHPLHLYHGFLGARSLLEHGNLSCYDPTFHGGYPKTPVFDSGSRPAELLLTLAGGRYSPAAYKVGLALVCVLVPVLLFTAARSVGLSRGASCLACVLGLMVWWDQPCRDALEAGEVDLLLATLLVLAQAGLLIRYHHDPGFLSWLGIAGTALLGWFAHPPLLALLLPLFLVYYLSVGTRHRLAWHLALLGGLLGAVGLNTFWLIDWIGYWWIRVPLPVEASPQIDSPLRAIWEAPLWGGPIEKGLTCAVVVVAAVGVFLYNGTSQRATARLLGLAWGGFLVLSVAGLTWRPLGRFGTDHLLVPALLFAALPAAHALRTALGVAWRRRSLRWAGLTTLAFLAAWLGSSSLGYGPALGHGLTTMSPWLTPVREWATHLLRPAPFRIGLDENQQALIRAVEEHTTSQARILWEDCPRTPLTPHWTALLAVRTERSYLGGLDAEAGIEHTANGLTERILAGRPIRDWSDEELSEYCRRYNIGWVACWSPTVYDRFSQWQKAERTTTLPPRAAGEPPGCLFTLRRKPSFALVGSAQWLAADAQHIVLTDVVPDPGGRRREDGKAPILLSLHYQAGMRVVPSRVELQPADLAQESIPFVRLWVAEPVTRVTITWDKR